MISGLIHLFFSIIYLIILIVILLSWIPIFNIKKEPVATLVKIYEAIMAPFKAVIPPIGMFDISPIVAIILLQILEQALTRLLGAFGL